jgi:hypothetical protein
MIEFNQTCIDLIAEPESWIDSMRALSIMDRMRAEELSIKASRAPGDLRRNK